MKQSTRIAVLAGAFMLCAGTLFGGTLYVPWFQDNGGPVGPDIVPPDGEATYIRLQNVTGGAINVTVDYYGTSGLIHTNTGTLSPSEVWAWRPHGNQGLIPDSGGAVTQTVMSAVISWPGGTNTDIVGNMITINTNGSRLGVNLVAP